MFVRRTEGAGGSPTQAADGHSTLGSLGYIEEGAPLSELRRGSSAGFGAKAEAN